LSDIRNELVAAGKRLDLSLPALEQRAEAAEAAAKEASVTSAKGAESATQAMMRLSAGQAALAETVEGAAARTDHRVHEV
jgi:hypothetical protein